MAEACVSDTDTEVVAQLIESAVASRQSGLLDAVQQVLPQLEGAYALAIVDREDTGSHRRGETR